MTTTATHTGASEMNGIEELKALTIEIQNEVPRVRREYSSLALAARLMARHKMSHIEEAVAQEARQRVLHYRIWQ